MSNFKTTDSLPICDGQHEHQNIETIRHDLPEDENFIEAADLFSLLSDSTRLKILWLLCHNEVCVCDIASAIDMSSPAVSHHLRSLKQLGIITFRRQGKEVHYTLSNSPAGHMVHKMIDTIITEEV